MLILFSILINFSHVPGKLAEECVKVLCSVGGTNSSQLISGTGHADQPTFTYL